MMLILIILHNIIGIPIKYVEVNLQMYHYDFEKLIFGKNKTNAYDLHVKLVKFITFADKSF